MTDDLKINLADPADIRAKLPDVERVVREKQEEFQEWDRLATRLARMVGAKRKRRSRSNIIVRRASDEDKPPREPSSKERVIKIVTKAKGPLTVEEVAAKIDVVLSRKTVGWALWKAVDEGELTKVRTGVYAPRGYVPSQAELNGTDPERAET